MEGTSNCFSSLGLVLGTINTLLTLFRSSIDWHNTWVNHFEKIRSRSKDADSVWTINCTGGGHCFFLGLSTCRMVWESV